MTATSTLLPDAADAVQVSVAGLPGFPDLSQLQVRPIDDHAIFVWLLADRPDDLAFLAVNPFVYFPSYDIEIDDSAEAGLLAEADDDLIAYCLVSVDEQANEATANLLAPVILNMTRLRAVQVVLEGDVPLRAPLPLPVKPNRAGPTSIGSGEREVTA